MAIEPTTPELESASTGIDTGAAATGLGAAGVGAALHSNPPLPKQMTNKQLLNKIQPGDIVMTGEYNPEGRLSAKNLKKALSRKGLSRKLDGLKVQAKRMFGNYVALGSRLVSATPFDHGGMAGAHTYVDNATPELDDWDMLAHTREENQDYLNKLSKKPRRTKVPKMLHMYGPAREDTIEALMEKNRVAVYRPKNVPKKSIKKAISFAAQAVRDGKGYDSVNAILSNVRNLVLPESVMAKITRAAKTMPPDAFCTNFPAIMYDAAGVTIAPGVRPKATLAKHLLTSKNLEPIGWTGKELSKGEKFRVNTLPRLMKALKWGGGAYLGYKGGKYLLDKYRGGAGEDHDDSREGI